MFACLLRNTQKQREARPILMLKLLAKIQVHFFLFNMFRFSGLDHVFLKPAYYRTGFSQILA